MSREDIVALHRQGPDAVVEFVEGLLVQLVAYQEQSRAQQETIASLTARLDELEDRLAQNSRNSIKPPSSDDPPDGPKSKSLRAKTGRSPGGQNGQRWKRNKGRAQRHGYR
jgi:hypothetical protein